jgi:O-antigen chain-terminating methyltransferase
MIAPFYRAFEDRHRGSRDLIKDRQKIYLPFIMPLQNLYASCPALDLDSTGFRR